MATYIASNEKADGNTVVNEEEAQIYKGNIVSLICNFDDSIKSVEAVSNTIEFINPMRIKKINLHNNNLSNIPSSEYLEEMRVSNNKIKDKVVVNCPRLKILIANNNDISKLSVESDNLNCLDVSHNVLKSINICSSPIVNLNLSFNRFDHKVVEYLNKSACRLTLKRLNISNNLLAGDLDFSAFENLTYLDISFNGVKSVVLPDSLQYVVCNNNLLTELTLKGEKKYSVLCFSNRLEQITIKTKIVNLHMHDNPNSVRYEEVE